MTVWIPYAQIIGRIDLDIQHPKEYTETIVMLDENGDRYDPYLDFISLKVLVHLFQRTITPLEDTWEYDADLQYLISIGLVKSDVLDGRSRYVLTDRGRTHVEKMMRMEFPEE